MDVSYSSATPAEIPCDVLVAFVPEGADLDALLGRQDLPLSGLDGAFGGKLTAWLKGKQFTGAEGVTITAPTFGRIAADTLILAGVGDGSPARVRAVAGKVAREARALKASRIGAWVADASWRAPALEGFGVGTYAYERKQEKDRSAPASALIFGGVDGDEASDRRTATIRKYQDWCRDLVNGPPAEIYPESLAGKAKELAAIPGVTVEMWDLAKLKAEGCVGTIAVGQGSDRPPCIIKATYRPKSATKAHVALVGKGVTFDSGGLSIKPSAGMQTMRCDMAGAATVLAALGAAAALELPVAIDCWVGAAENMTGGSAFKLGDILTYANGVTVENHNTDAEGRLVLADCLIQASRGDATHIIDLATLTGACVVALGPDFSGLFTHDEALAADLMAVGAETGEAFWRLPLHKPYKDGLKADWAQLKNVAGRDAGATTAALFLEHFVGKGKRWAHLDIAGPAFLEKPSGPYAAGATGNPMRSVVRWLEKLGA